MALGEKCFSLTHSGNDIKFEDKAVGWFASNVVSIVSCHAGNSVPLKKAKFGFVLNPTSDLPLDSAHAFGVIAFVEVGESVSEYLKQTLLMPSISSFTFTLIQ